MRFAGSQLSNFIDPSNFDAISKTSMKGRSTERMYQAGAEATVEKANIDAEAMIKSAKYGASATRAQGSAAGQSSMFGGIANGIGSIAGGFINRSTPKPAPGQPIPTNMNPVDSPGSYLSGQDYSLGQLGSLTEQW